MPREPVVITGLGVVSSIGIGAAEYFQGLLDRRSGVRSLSERSDGDAVPRSNDPIDGVWIGAPIVDFQPKAFVKPRKALKVMCREIQTAFASARLACDHAGLSDSIPATADGLIPPERLAAVYGSEIFFNPPEELATSVAACIDEDGSRHPGRFGQAARREIMPLWMLKYLPNMPACQVGISLNSQGPNNSLVLGDVSGPSALIEAESYLQRGLADVAVAGATGTRIGTTRMIYHGEFSVAHRHDRPIEDTSQPHNDQVNGVVGGEGAASLVLETSRHAANRNAQVFAELLATASRFVPTIRMKSEIGSDQPFDQVDAMKSTSAAIAAVLDEASISADEVALVVSHAMGQREVDRAERAMLQNLGFRCPQVAPAASIGHTGAASGMIEISTAAMALSLGQAPPTRNASAADHPQLLVKAQPLEGSHALCVAHTGRGASTAVLLRAANAK